MNESIGDESRAGPGLSLDAARLIEGGSHDEVAARHARWPLRKDQSLAQRCDGHHAQAQRCRSGSFAAGGSSVIKSLPLECRLPHLHHFLRELWDYGYVVRGYRGGDWGSHAEL